MCCRRCSKVSAHKSPTSASCRIGRIACATRCALPRRDRTWSSPRGVSTGEEDHVKAAIEALGRLHFWRLAIKPGRPIALGQIGKVPFMGLPGNPVAVMVTFLILGRPLVLRLSGAETTAPRRFRVAAAFDYRKRPNRCEYVRVRLSPGSDGGWLAHKFPRDGAGILSSMVESDGLAEIGEGISRIEPGMSIDFIPFGEVLE